MCSVIASRNVCWRLMIACSLESVSRCATRRQSFRIQNPETFVVQWRVVFKVSRRVSRLHFVLQNTWGNSPRAVCKTLGYQCGCVISACLKASKGSKIHVSRKSGKPRIRTWRSTRYITFSAINTTAARGHENCCKPRGYIVQSNILLLVHNTLSLVSWTTQCYRKLYNIDSWTILNA